MMMMMMMMMMLMIMMMIMMMMMMMMMMRMMMMPRTEVTVDGRTSDMSQSISSLLGPPREGSSRPLKPLELRRG